MEEDSDQKWIEMSVLTKISLDHSLEKAGALATYLLEKVAE